MTMKAVDFLKSHQVKTSSSWREAARYRADNWPWLRYSYAIAIRVSGRMRALGITQKELAEKMGCTQQNVSTLLKGQANMTLETISKLEAALNMNLVGHLLDFDGSGYEPYTQKSGYLNDPGPDEETSNMSTKDCVDGYGAK